MSASDSLEEGEILEEGELPAEVTGPLVRPAPACHRSQLVLVHSLLLLAHADRTTEAALSIPDLPR